MTHDPRAARQAELTADAQKIRASDLPREVKRAMLADIQGEIDRLTRERNAHHAQRVNGVSSMEQRNRRLS